MKEERVCQEKGIIAQYVVVKESMTTGGNIAKYLAHEAVRIKVC